MFVFKKFDRQNHVCKFTVEVGKHPQVILAMYFYLGQE
jgi:hypothetical protein